MMAKEKPKKEKKPPKYVVLMVPVEFRRQVNSIATHTGENAPEVVRRVAGGVVFAEFRKLVMES